MRTSNCVNFNITFGFLQFRAVLDLHHRFHSLQELTFFKIKYEGLIEEHSHYRNRWSVAAAAAAASNIGPDGVSPNSVDPINSNPA